MSKQLFVRRDQGDVVVLRILENELSDLVLQDQLDSALLDFVEFHRPQKLLLDLSDVAYCATGVINTILLVRNRVVSWGGECRLCALSDSLRKAFRTLNLEPTVFTVHESAADAVAALAEPTQPPS